MPSSLRIISAVLIFVLVIGLAVTLLGYRLVVKSLPDYHDPIDLSLLEAETTIYWDEYKVPHIYAQNERDMFRVAGYLAAQERLWQMDLARRAALGRLSEIFGERTLDSDIFFHTWGLSRIAERLANNLPETTLEALRYYTDGINMFIDSHQNTLPIEFSILGYKPEKWKFTDSIAFTRLMAFRLSFTWHLEPVLYLIAEKVGREKALQLFPEFPKNAPVIVSRRSQVNTEMFSEFLDRSLSARKIFGGSGAVAVSNSWVISSQKSVTGKPILANDPHLNLDLPSIWYEMHLVGGDYDVMGVTFPGVPGVVIGHNRAAAWGLTNGMIDDADFYFERINPDNPEQYWDGKSWQPLEISREEIRVKDADDPVYIDVRISKNGPIVSPVHPLYETDSLAISVRWTGQEISDEIGAMLGVNKARNWKTFLAAAKKYKAPAQNFIYADTTGTIGYALAGNIPVRRDGKGYFLYRGWENRGDWIDSVPFEKLPKQRNPARGFIATANNKMVAKNRRIYFGNAWEPDSRIQRITELLTEKKKLSVKDFERMHTDVQSYHAKKMLRHINPILKKAPLSDLERHLQKILELWDCNESWQSVQATIYNVMFVRLLKNTLEDEVGSEILNEFLYWTNFPIRAMENLITLPESDWWDDKRTSQCENMEMIVVMSFKGTIRQLYSEMGEGPGFWEWGLAHKMTFSHPLGQHAPLNRVFNDGPYPIGGSANSIAKAEFQFTQPYRVDAGASMRQIVDLANPDRAWSVIAGGQSGQPFSDYYTDQVELWLNGKYKVARMARSEIEQNAESTQLFRPKE